MQNSIVSQLGNHVSENLSRKERERILRRTEILSAAMDVFSEKGFSRATLEEIAERAEFGKGTLYNYFANKEELFEAVIADVFDRFVDIADHYCGQTDRPVKETLQGIADAMLRFLHERSRLVFLLMREIHQPSRKSFVTVLFPDLLALLEQPFEQARLRGEIADLPGRRLAYLYLNMLFALFQTSVRVEYCMMHDEAHGRRSAQTGSVGNGTSENGTGGNGGDSGASERADIDAMVAASLATIEATFFHGIIINGSRTPTSDTILTPISTDHS